MNKPAVYSGIRSRFVLSHRYCPADLDLNAYQVPTPESKKRSSMIQGQNNTNLEVCTVSLCSGFFKIQLSVSKGRMQ